MTLRENAVSGGVSAKIPKASRLLRHADFRLVYEQGRRHFSTNFTAFYRPNPGENAAPRIGYTVSRALGGAVDRNRMKRRLRDATRACWAGFAPENAVDVVVNPKKTVLRAEFADLTAEMRRALAVIEKNAAANAHPTKPQSGFAGTPNARPAEDVSRNKPRARREQR